MNRTITSFGLFFLLLTSFKTSLAMNDGRCQDAIKQKFEELCTAAASNNATKCKDLLIQGCNPNFCFSDGSTPLSIAAELGADESLKTLLEYKANPNFHLSGRELPVTFAFLNNHISTTLILLSRGSKLPNISIGKLILSTNDKLTRNFMSLILTINDDITLQNNKALIRNCLQNTVNTIEKLAKILVFFGWKPEITCFHSHFSYTLPDGNYSIDLSNLQPILTDPDYVKNHPEEFEFIRKFELQDSLERKTNKKQVVHYLLQREIGQR